MKTVLFCIKEHCMFKKNPQHDAFFVFGLKEHCILQVYVAMYMYTSASSNTFLQEKCPDFYMGDMTFDVTTSDVWHEIGHVLLSKELYFL